jgi:hypothetical protein
MQRLIVKDFKPPFITETDEVKWDDCTVCSTLMAVSAATLGEVTKRKDWSDLDSKGLKARREKIRNWLPAEKQTGPTTMEDMRFAFGKEFPWLPSVPLFEEQSLIWREVIDRLLANGVGVLLGNPKNVANEASHLRRWTNNDDFGHAIYADRARKNADGTVDIFIMDPLGSGAYDGEWVPATEVKEFIDEYPGGVKANMFKRGAWADKTALVGVVSSDEGLAAELEVVKSSLELSIQRYAELKDRVSKAATGIGVAADNTSELVQALEASLA